MAHLIPRIREARIDALFAGHLRRPNFGAAFLGAARLGGEVAQVDVQRPHPGGSGTVDLWLRLADRTVLLVENKIDARWSVAGDEDQPARYRASVENLKAMGLPALSVLLAPRHYLSGSRQAGAFDRQVAYEDCLPHLDGEDRALLAAAIAQAARPYEPEPDAPTGEFFSAFRAHVQRYWPGLVLKREPNASGARPTASRTFYFDVARTLRPQPHLPTPRMSLQSWDSAAASPSVKIMLGGLAARADRVDVPRGLAAIGGHIRPAGGSLGLVLDTPRLEPRAPFVAQVAAVDTCLGRAQILKDWWDAEAGELQLS